MQVKGFYLSLEAIISLLLLSALIVMQTPEQETNTGLKELVILQKENDLLRVWLIQGSFNEKEMVEDFQFVFPNANGKITVDGKEIVIGKQEKNTVASSTLFFDNIMAMHSIKLSVFN